MERYLPFNIALPLVSLWCQKGYDELSGAVHRINVSLERMDGCKC